MLGLSGNAFARLEKHFPQTGPCRPVFCPVLCSEGPSMAVTYSAHDMTHMHVEIHRSRTTPRPAVGTAGGAGERL